MACKNKWLVVMVGDVEPKMMGPYETDAARLGAAKKYRNRHGKKDDGLFMFDGEGEFNTFAGSDLDFDEENLDIYN